MVKARFLTLAHGAGGVETGEILEELVLSKFPPELKKALEGYGTDVLDDGATLKIGGLHVVLSIDAYTVNPPFFPGGNIGVLAASGSINDVLMMGGRPVAMMDSIVAQEGFPVDKLDVIMESFAKVLRENGVALIGGDLKVLPKDDLSGVVITTVGVGLARKVIVDRDLRPGDKIVVSGPLGEHGATILALQYGVDLGETQLRSDARPLTDLMLPLLEKYGDHIHAARDPTRGGLAMTLNDWARESGTVIVVEEDSIPLREPVVSYAEMLGIEPLALASEGVAVLGVAADVAEEIVGEMRRLGYSEASVIGEARRSEKYSGYVLYKSSVGGVRILEPPRGELVPRIC